MTSANFGRERPILLLVALELPFNIPRRRILMLHDTTTELESLVVSYAHTDSRKAHEPYHCPTRRMTTQYPPPPSRDPPPELPRRRNVNTSEPTIPAGPSTSYEEPSVMDSIKSKLPFTHEHEEGDDDSFDVIGYWAITALSW
jgi:hypothetical protein